jgi:hypothetical protein
MFLPQQPQVRRCPLRQRPRLPSAIRTSLRKARSTPKIRGALRIQGRKTRRSGISFRRHFLRRQPTLAACPRISSLGVAGVWSVKAVVVVSVGFEELICAITRSAVVMLGFHIASNSAFTWKNLAWIVVICQLVSNIHRPAVLSDGGGNNTLSTSGGRERGRLESRST